MSKSIHGDDEARSRGLAGFWQGSGASLLIRKNGILEIAGKMYLYTIRQNNLVIAPLTTAIEIPYRQNGDALSLIINGQEAVLMRPQKAGPGDSGSVDRDDAASNETSQSLKETKSSPAAPKSSSALSRVAGVWVGTESALDSSFYMSYTRYLILYPDGSVSYAQTEGGATRVQVTESMERFNYFSSGRAGNRDIEGQWQSDANTIIVRWRNNTIWQGQIDPMNGRIVMFGIGVIEGGSNVLFQRQ